MEEEMKKEAQPVTMINPYKLWKLLYFSAEDALTATIRKSVTTGEFANGIDLILNSYLQYLKMHNEFIGRYMEDSPFSSKRDVARVAELVVSLENKLDSLEGQFEENLAAIEDTTGLISEQLSKQPEAIIAEELSQILAPTMTAVNDLSKRVSDLEIIIKRIDSGLTDISKSVNVEANKKIEKTSPAKTQETGPTLKEMMANRKNPPSPKVQKPKPTGNTGE